MRKLTHLAVVCSAVSEEPIVRFINLPSHLFAPGLSVHEFSVVYPDQHHESLRECIELAD